MTITGCLIALIPCLPMSDAQAAVAEPPGASRAPAASAPNQRGPGLRLEPRRDLRTGADILVGAFTVPERREDPGGRSLELDLVVLPATGDDPAPDPVFVLAGGPGVNAAAGYAQHLESWIRARRDIVLLSQRGTGGSCRLQCDLIRDRDDPQGALDLSFDANRFERCRDELAQHFDLRRYSTPIAMDDLNELRAALGYDRINLMGGSYGTRAALVYLRRHPGTVRTMILNGVAPLAFTNPLFHARESQAALEEIIAECAADPACSAAFPDLAARLEIVLQRLDAEPARATVRHPVSGEAVEVRLSRAAFAETLRFVMYTDSRSVPLLIRTAFEGDVAAAAQRGLENALWISEAISFGMLLCVTCSEDVDRIDPQTIPGLTQGTFLGDRRVRDQIAACALWPRSALPEGFGDPVRSDVPVLLLSGTLDPVTPPRWGEQAARHLNGSVHLVVPGAHGVGGPCIRRIEEAFLEAGGAEALDTSCVERIELGPFAGTS